MNTKKELTRMQYEVIDNYLPREEFEAIRNIMLSKEIGWYFNPTVTFENQEDDHFYFTHMMVCSK